MKIDGNEVRPGHVIDHNNRLWRVMRTKHVQPGKGGAYMQVELRDIRDNTKLNDRLRADQSVERVRLEQRAYQFLYTDGEMYTFMDLETFDQVTVGPAVFAEGQTDFLQEGMQVTLEFYEDEPLNVQLPETVTLEITFAEPVVKGQTATASYKPATLDNGVRTMVPPHIETGQRVVIATEDGSYVERARD
mgnify:CR=1 FL=1